jgi:hypothetical protein
MFARKDINEIPVSELGKGSNINWKSARQNTIYIGR